MSAQGLSSHWRTTSLRAVSTSQPSRVTSTVCSNWADSERSIVRTVHSHPTLSEVLAEAAADIFGESIHKVRSRR